MHRARIIHRTARGSALRLPSSHLAGLFSPVSQKIPAYAPDNQTRRRSYSLEAIERFLALDLVVAIRGRKGKILRVYFREADGGNPLRTSAHMGQAYSYEHHLPSGRSVWKHRKLVRDERDLAALFGEPPDDPVEADLFVRAIFRAVPLSCIQHEQAPEPPKKTPGGAKVIPIDSARRKKPAKRPAEFDSEWRKAA